MKIVGIENEYSHVFDHSGSTKLYSLIILVIKKLQQMIHANVPDPPRCFAKIINSTQIFMQNKRANDLMKAKKDNNRIRLAGRNRSVLYLFCVYMI